MIFGERRPDHASRQQPAADKARAGGPQEGAARHRRANDLFKNIAFHKA